MTSFGTQLRSAREEKGWSIEYVSFKSKIQPGIIENLENDDYSGFSSSSYVKSFLRKYADFLELDLDDEIGALEIVGYDAADTYSVREGVNENLEVTEFSKKNQRYRKAEKSKGSPVFLAGSVVVLLSAIATFYYLGSQANTPEVGAREILKDFENQKSPFTREREAKERLVSEKKPVRPIETAASESPPLASRRAHSSVISRRPPPSVTTSTASSPIQKLDPLSELETIQKPSVREISLPGLDEYGSSASTPTVRAKDLNPLMEF